MKRYIYRYDTLELAEQEMHLFGYIKRWYAFITKQLIAVIETTNFFTLNLLSYILLSIM